VLTGTGHPPTLDPYRRRTSWQPGSRTTCCRAHRAWG